MTTNKLNGYETLYLVKPTILEEDALTVIEKYETLLKKHTDQVITQNKGKRHLTYCIKGYNDSFFIEMNYKGNGNLVNLLEKYLRLDENILRYQTILS
uniref:Small ribosomal subunit protein bS6c n=1 Tax=Haptophyceae sp. NIES-3900 TaxID=2748608 RepID=A0A7R6WEZ7_9EUKA|nr:ribosomal protein S6 [Haptophyceae sp. NIES-3900]